MSEFDFYINFAERKRDVTLSPLRMVPAKPRDILLRYYEINNIKLNRTYDVLNQRQRDFLTLIPLLFHNNDEIKCHVRDCPAGIPNFSLTAEMMEATRRIKRTYSYNPQSFRQFNILAVYLMGSLGTIAYSQKSDFDFWLCYRPGISDYEIGLLEEKADLITRWAEELNLEVTIFLVNYEEFRKGKTTELSLESSGSSQHLLLLEEFYRTAVLLCGQYPIWWLIPPDAKDHETTKAQLLKDNPNIIRLGDFIDFGPVQNIPADEFLGGTVWQIYKGIDSPYKSILKLMLMEVYASEFPNIKLISMVFKEHVFTTQYLDIDQIDPYILLLDKLTQYLEEQQYNERLMVVRKCFYTKLDCPLSSPTGRKTQQWRYQLVDDFINKWEWSIDQYQLLDQRSEWKINHLVDEQKQLVDALNAGYMRLSEFFSANDSTGRISKRDLNLLGRKLYAAFERAPGKIQIINRQNKPQLLENVISVMQFFRGDGENGWKLFQGVIRPSEVDSKEALNQSTHLMKLVTWLYFNGVVNHYTIFVISVNHRNYQPSKQEMARLVKDYERVWPTNIFSNVSLETLSKPSFVEKNMLVINSESDPFYNSEPQPKTLNTDSLSYGLGNKNLVMSLDLVFSTSWKEVMYFHYANDDGLLQCISQYLIWNQSFWRYHDTKRKARIMPDLTSSYSSSRGSVIASRVQQLIEDVINCFADDKKQPHHHYLFTVGKQYFMIWMDNQQPQYKKIPSIAALYRELSQPSKHFFTLKIDRNFIQEPHLSDIFQYNEATSVQFFYFNHIKYVDIYILDDFGALYYRRLKMEERNVHINHYILFLTTIINRRRLTSAYDSTSDLDMTLTDSLNLKIYKMSREAAKLKIEEQSRDKFPLPKEFLNIQAIGNVDDNNHPYFSVYCDEEEFSALDYGRKMYHELAKFVFANRKSGLRYPIYLTDMDLRYPDAMKGRQDGTKICQLLNYKEQIEQKINKALKEI